MKITLLPQRQFSYSVSMTPSEIKKILEENTEPGKGGLSQKQFEGEVLENGFLLMINTSNMKQRINRIQFHGLIEKEGGTSIVSVNAKCNSFTYFTLYLLILMSIALTVPGVLRFINNDFTFLKFEYAFVIPVVIIVFSHLFSILRLNGECSEFQKKMRRLFKMSDKSPS